MAFVGTITLNANYVIIQPATTSITAIGGTAMGEILQVGADVADWNVSDIVLVNTTNMGSFKENNITYQLVNQDNIYFKYEAAALP